MRSKKLNTIFSGGMYGGKNTLIVASVDRRQAVSHDVTLSKNLFFDSLSRDFRRNPGCVYLSGSDLPHRV